MLGFLSEDNFTCILFPSTAEHIKMKVKLTDFMIKIIKAFVILECSACWVSYMRCLLLSSFIEIVHPKLTFLLFTYPYVILNMECCYFRFETQIEKTLCSSFHSDHICQAPKRGKKCLCDLLITFQVFWSWLIAIVSQCHLHPFKKYSNSRIVSHMSLQNIACQFKMGNEIWDIQWIGSFQWIMNSHFGYFFKHRGKFSVL